MAVADNNFLPRRVTGPIVAMWAINYQFKQGDPVVIASGRYKGHRGVVDSAVFQRNANYPDEFAPGCHVVLDDQRVVTVRSD